MKSIIFTMVVVFASSSFGLQVTECLLTSDKIGNESNINRYLVRGGYALTISSVEVGRINPVVPETEFIILKGFHTPSSVKAYASQVAASEQVNMNFEGCNTQGFE